MPSGSKCMTPLRIVRTRSRFLMKTERSKGNPSLSQFSGFSSSRRYSPKLRSATELTARAASLGSRALRRSSTLNPFSISRLGVAARQRVPVLSRPRPGATPAVPLQLGVPPRSRLRLVGYWWTSCVWTFLRWCRRGGGCAPNPARLLAAAVGVGITSKSLELSRQWSAPRLHDARNDGPTGNRAIFLPYWKCSCVPVQCSGVFISPPSFVVEGGLRALARSVFFWIAGHDPVTPDDRGVDRAVGRRAVSLRILRLRLCLGHRVLDALLLPL